MDYYRITERDVQFTNCRYCLKYYPKNMIITDDKNHKIIFKDEIEYTIEPDLYIELTSPKTSGNEDAQRL